jgi:sugar lactone lactonase YvrE
MRNCTLGKAIAENLHPVASPAVDSQGNIYTTRSGTRGEQVPVSVFKIDTANNTHAFASEIVNPTGLVMSPSGELLVSGRNNGAVYTVTPGGSVSIYAEGMGVATGMAMDGDGNLYVGDRTGTIFKIAPDRQIFVFATVESSIAAFHLAFGPDGYLYLTGPTTSSFDCVQRITPNGDVEEYLRGFGRPQGIAFDRGGRLYLAASYQGLKGIFRIDQEKSVTQVVSGPGIVGLAFLPSGDMAVTTSNSVYRVATADWISA